MLSAFVFERCCRRCGPSPSARVELSRFRVPRGHSRPTRRVIFKCGLSDPSRRHSHPRMAFARPHRCTYISRRYVRAHRPCVPHAARHSQHPRTSLTRRRKRQPKIPYFPASLSVALGARLNSTAPQPLAALIDITSAPAGRRLSRRRRRRSASHPAARS